MSKVASISRNVPLVDVEESDSWLTITSRLILVAKYDVIGKLFSLPAAPLFMASTVLAVGSCFEWRCTRLGANTVGSVRRDWLIVYQCDSDWLTLIIRIETCQIYARQTLKFDFGIEHVLGNGANDYTQVPRTRGVCLHFFLSLLMFIVHVTPGECNTVIWKPRFYFVRTVGLWEVSRYI